MTDQQKVEAATKVPPRIDVWPKTKTYKNPPLLCPDCKGEMRLQVHVVLDIPPRLEGKLSKRAIRDTSVRLEGAAWDSAVVYCKACGFRLGPKS